MLVDSNGLFITQRKQATMCWVQAELNQSQLTLSVKDKPLLNVSIADCLAGKPCTVVVWGDQVQAYDCGEQAAQWWSDYLQQDCRMVFMADNCRRPVFPDSDSSAFNNQATVSFADRFPLLLISEASLDYLNQHLSKPIGMQRFRPNIVLSGCEPFAEDSWQRIRIGDIELDVTEDCARCGIPAINPETARPEKDVLSVLSRYRRREQQVYFGQNLIHRQEGQLHLDAPVEILS
jgi:uncharacterized protein YcbX